MNERRSNTPTLIAALRIISRDTHSGDGVANAAIAEAADRLEDYYNLLVCTDNILDKSLIMMLDMAGEEETRAVRTVRSIYQRIKDCEK